VLELDETMPEAHALMGALQSGQYDWSGAERKFRHALELDSRSEKAWAWLWIYYSIWYLLPLKRYEQTLAALQKGIDLDPLSPFFQWLLAFFYYLTRQWDRALDQCRSVIEIDSNYYLAYQYLGFTCLEKGMFDEGIRYCEMAARAVGESPWALVFPEIAYARAGRTEESNRLLGELQELGAKSPVSPSAFAWIYCSLGEIDKGLNWFERSINDHDGLIPISYAFPLYDPLRSHPRYRALLRKMNLEP
jgi:tetratricopeptide (TPR) repeat protein